MLEQRYAEVIVFQFVPEIELEETVFFTETGPA